MPGRELGLPALRAYFGSQPERGSAGVRRRGWLADRHQPVISVKHVSAFRSVWTISGSLRASPRWKSIKPIELSLQLLVLGRQARRYLVAKRLAVVSEPVTGRCSARPDPLSLPRPARRGLLPGIGHKREGDLRAVRASWTFVTLQ